MRQKQRDGRWQGQVALQAIDNHSEGKSFAEAGSQMGEKHQRAAKYRAVEKHRVAGKHKRTVKHQTVEKQQSAAKHQTMQGLHLTPKLRVGKPLGGKALKGKPLTGLGEQRPGQEGRAWRWKPNVQEPDGQDRPNRNGVRAGIRIAVAAVAVFSLFFLGKGIGFATRGTVQTSAELLAQTDNWGLGFGKEGAQPTGNVSAGELAKYDAWYVGEAGKKEIYLTFDAGFENGNTEPILDALKKHNAPATFFVVGHYLETAPELVKRMVAEGHTVGNHTWHHPDMSSISSKEAFSEEMGMVEEKYKELTGEELVKFYRPPQGKYNLENLKMAQELGYKTFFWSLAYVDWYQDKQPSHEEAFEKLTKRIHPGAVVLLHSTSKTNGEILDELLTKWEGMGYTFRPLSDFAD